jgi:hypothetical protein
MPQDNDMLSLKPLFFTEIVGNPDNAIARIQNASAKLAVLC